MVERFRIQVRYETEWVHAFNEVLVNSQFSRESVLRSYGRLAQVCPPGIDTDRFSLQARPNTARGNVLSVGAMVEAKNPLFLVGAVAAATPAVSQFVWVANYVDERCRQQVERAAAEAGVPFDLRPRVSDHDLMRAYADADVFVYAPRLEPLGLAPLEANATGLPVVAVAEAGVRETIIDGVNGTIVEHDPEQFGAALAALLGDSARTRTLGRSARDHILQNWALAPSIKRLEAQLHSAQTAADL
jgi:glycosyltransferase involved in cell wall biosynthesis